MLGITAAVDGYTIYHVMIASNLPLRFESAILSGRTSIWRGRRRC